MKQASLFSAVPRLAVMALAFPISCFLAAAQPADSEAATRLLKQANIHAAQARIDAEFLNSNSISALGWQVDINRLMRIEEHVKELSGDLRELQTVRAEVSPQQKAAIDRFESLLGGMSSKVSNTIWWLYQNQNQVNMPPFRDRARQDLIAVDEVYRHLRQSTNNNSNAYNVAKVDKP
jgi:hypothetical protein